MTERYTHPHRFTVADYYRMVEAGVLAPDARVELIEGEVVDMAPIGSRHSYYVGKLVGLLPRAIGDRAFVQCQSPVRLSDISEPQPDFAVLRLPERSYELRLPGPGDVLLLIEVSDTTLRDDLRTKVPLYARHGIPEVWVVDAASKGTLHVFRVPDGGGYRQTFVARAGEPLAISGVEGAFVDLSSL